MKYKHETMTCANIQALIESYLDQELMPEQLSQIEGHLCQCSTCAEELKLAKQVNNTLRTLPVHYCPDYVKEAVLEQIRTERRVNLWERVQAWPTNWRALKWRSAFATAVLVALVIAIVLIVRYQQPSSTQVSPEELARAEFEVKWTLAYVSEIGQRTSISVRNDVIVPWVVAPMKQAIESVLENELNPDSEK
ncbi:MAG: zf-HC2 domain-containing protein [bacterium]